MTQNLAYERDGAAIYRQSFAIIRAEADLSAVPADLEHVAVRMIHACGMTDLPADLAWSPGVGSAARDALARGAAVLCRENLRREPAWSAKSVLFMASWLWRTAFFAASAAKRAAAEAGLPRAASAREAEDLIRDAETFLRVAERALGVDGQSLLPLRPAS